MCPPNAVLNPLQRWLDTAICVKYLAIRRHRVGDEPELICVNCYLHEDLHEELEGTKYDGETHHYLHIGNRRHLDVCFECSDPFYIIDAYSKCNCCTLEYNRYSAGLNNAEVPRESVIIEIERTTITDRLLNFPNFV